MKRDHLNSGTLILVFASMMCALFFAFLDLWIARTGDLGQLDVNWRVMIPLGLLGLALVGAILVNLGAIIETLSSRRAYVALLFAVNVGVVGGVTVLVNYISAKHYRTFDGTTKSLYRISERTESVLRNLTRPVKANVIGSPYHECFPTVRATLDMYSAAAGDQLTVDYFDPQNDRERLKSRLQALGVNPQEVEDANIVVFECASGGAGVPRTKFITFAACVEREGGGFGGDAPIKAFKAEGLFTEAILSVARETKTKVVFLVGHDEVELVRRSDEGQLATLDTTLRRLNYEVDTFELDFAEGSGKQDIPADADVLVIAGARSRFSDKEIERLKAFLDGGGHALVMTEPIIKTRPGSTSVFFENVRLDGLLKEYGITIDPSVVVDLASRGPFAVDARVDEYASHPIVKPLAKAVLTLFKVQPLIVAQPDAMSRVKVSTLLETRPSAVSVKDVSGLERTQNPTAVEHRKGPLTLAVVATREVEAPTPTASETPTGTAAPAPAKRETRLIVTGDTTFATDDLALNFVGNLDFAVNCISWLAAREESLSIGVKRPEKIHLNLDADQHMRVKLLSLLILPIACAMIGLAVFTGRRS